MGVHETRQILDHARWWRGGKGTSQEVADWWRDHFVSHAGLRQCSKPDGCSDRLLQRDREARDDLVLEENSLDEHGAEVPKVG